jgi:hypothetical protein
VKGKIKNQGVMSMWSLPPQSRLTQLLYDRVSENAAIRFGWMGAGRVEGKDVVALKFSETTAERGHFAIRGLRRPCWVFEARAWQVAACSS